MGGADYCAPHGIADVRERKEIMSPRTNWSFPRVGSPPKLVSGVWYGDLEEPEDESSESGYDCTCCDLEPPGMGDLPCPQPLCGVPIGHSQEDHYEGTDEDEVVKGEVPEPSKPAAL